MRKTAKTLGAVHTHTHTHTHTHGITSERRKKLTLRVKSIIALVLILPLLHFSPPVQAREELPDNLIEQKDAKINEIMLGAGSDFALDVTYNKSTKSAKLTWSAVANASDYIVYQQKNGGEQLVIDTGKATTTTVNNVKDTTAPNVPQVTATLTADEFGNNLTIKPSTDKGTEYSYMIEAMYNGKSMGGDVVIMCDFGKKNDDYVIKAFEELKKIVNILINERDMRVGIVFNGGDKSARIYQLTKSYNEAITFINSAMSQKYIGHATVAQGFPYAIQMLEKGNATNKAILMIQDHEDKVSNSTRHYYGKQLVAKNIKLYVIGSGCSNSGNLNTYKAYGKVAYARYVDQIAGVFNEMMFEISDEFKKTSNTKSITVTSGLKGYKYAITTRSTHTFLRNDPIVQLKDIPTYVSGENLPVQYLHIVAVDNELNESPVSTVPLKVPTKIRLRTTYEKGMNYVPLYWTINNPTPGYTYSLYRQELEEDPTTKKLVVKDESLIETITDTTRTLSYTVPGTYYWTVPEDVTELKVAVAGGGGRRSNCNRSNCSIWGQW